jgi:hypothetical protein
MAAGPAKNVAAIPTTITHEGITMVDVSVPIAAIGASGEIFR